MQLTKIIGYNVNTEYNKNPQVLYVAGFIHAGGKLGIVLTHWQFLEIFKSVPCEVKEYDDYFIYEFKQN